MRRILAITVLLALLAAAIPAYAATGKTPISDAVQAANAVLAAKHIHKLTLAPGESFSFNQTVGPRTESAGYAAAETDSGESIVGLGCAHAATALYQALKNLDPGSVSFDEICYAADGKSLLTDYENGRDFRFTNLSSGEMYIKYDAADGKLICKVTVSEPKTTATAAPERPPMFSKDGSAVVIDLSSDPGVIANLTLAAGTLCDTTLAKGDIFSFNDVIGPATAEFGYLPAPDGRGQTISGGGLNRLASALWLLIQHRDDMVIVEKSTYGNTFAQTYVANSADAIFTDSASGADFAFRYTGEGAVTFYAAVQEGVLTVSIQ